MELIEAGTGHVLRLTVADADRGKLIGRRGTTLRSLSTIVRAISAFHGGTYKLDIAAKSPEDELPGPKRFNWKPSAFYPAHARENPPFVQ